MPVGLLDIKRRIKSVKNTHKITRAVSLVASSKFGRIRPMLYRVSSYFEKYREVMEERFLGMNMEESIFYKSNSADTDLYIVITADAGLCGNYNTNAINRALRDMHGKKVILATIGERGRNYFKRRGYETLSEFVEIGTDPSVEEVNNIMKEAIDYFKQGKAQNVYIVYTRFYSPVKQEVQVLKVLPAEAPNSGTAAKTAPASVPRESNAPGNEIYLFEPSMAGVFQFIFPKYLNSLMYYTLINSIASEYASKITSMEGATKNASDILDKLQTIYNKARQSSITQEITEIVSGAEALKG